MMITRLVKTNTHDNNRTHDDDDDDDGWWRQQRWRPRGNDGDGDDDDDDVLRLNKTDVCERARVCVIGFVFCHTTDW